ncbi:Gfo/Idh/MocA family protein [Pontiella agarivorans]|uniref:Gfo/Idh/MocA family oxidoreductase n=1 Tax=Pontiella agarivorans TaxID=3038953 RepID=A0ABU5MTQ8_9BACT|nr:Gfo/Idh/MocA family oxidoreductase [Pontiella agarivorans]MDZ8117532.1 Gfo/Idh/MocA family oxidoreductase [Pontiella agarivorans]
MSLNKRNFIKLSATAGASLPLFSIGASKTAMEDLRVGCIGMGRMMYWHVNGFMQRCRLVAVCDVDKNRREAERDRVNAHYGNRECVAYNDYRELLARDDIDVVCIATPDHWHATIVIDAARAGKHIYCEKPLTHDIDEAIRVMKEVKKAGVVLQTGSQQRGMKEFRVAAELVRNNVVGKVLEIKSDFWGPGRPFDLPEEEMESGLDWNRWCGPGPLNHYNSKLSPRGVHDFFPMGWRNAVEYGGGGICDMGAHHLDIIQLALDMDKSGPVKALPPAGGGNGYGAKLVYEGGLEVTREKGFMVDFICENGRIQASRGKFRFELDGKVIHKFLEPSDGSLAREVVLTEREFLADAEVKLPVQKKGGHTQNFLDAIVNGTQPMVPVEAGARSAICCHLMNLSYYHQQPILWDPEKLKFSDKSCDPAWLAGSRRDYLKA